MAKTPVIGEKYVTPPKHSALIAELHKNYTIGKTIGWGHYGIVCDGTMGKGFLKYEIAIKIIDLAKTSNDYQTKFLPKELFALEELKHYYITKVYDITLCDNTLYVFMEKAFGGDLLNMLEEYKDGIPESKTKILYKMIASALHYIHERGSSHRDIKCENILLMNKERTIAKLTDFGCSTTCFAPKTHEKLLRHTYVGTPGYRAPEIERQKPYDAMRADVWSLGVVLFVMLQNELPFRYTEVHKLSKDPKAVKLVFKNKNLSEECKDLLSKQLEADPKKRITMAQVVEHQWIADKTLLDNIKSYFQT